MGISDVDIVGQYEVLGAYPSEFLKDERDALVADVAREIRGADVAKDGWAPVDDFTRAAYEVRALAAIRDMVRSLGVRGVAGQVLAARMVLDELRAASVAADGKEAIE